MPCDPTSGCGCNCGPTPSPTPTPAATGLGRREFLAAGGAGLAMALTAPVARAIAGPFALEDLVDFPVPADKRFTAEWLEALTAAGEPTVYTSQRGELRYIGMPVGGICCGQVYLSGDGRLWHWDIFNLPPSAEWSSSQGPLYAKPAEATQTLEQRVRVTIDGAIRTVDAEGFADVRFRGQYPIATIEYRDAACPVEIALEAFSPFIPLDVESSSLPATILSYTITNPTSRPLEVELAATLENRCSPSAQPGDPGVRRNRVEPRRGEQRAATMVVSDVVPTEPPPPRRPDILLEDFERGYAGWTATGTAFGKEPRRVKDMAGYQGRLDAHGEGLVNTHETRSGEDVVAADSHLGTLLSDPFTLGRDFIRFRLSGGNHPGQTCVNLLVDGAPVRTATGRNSNLMHRVSWDVREFAGRQVRLQVVDAVRGGWGHVGVDEIVLSDQAVAPETLHARPDWGTLALAVLSGLDDPGVRAQADIGEAGASPQVRRPFGKVLVGRVARTVRVLPGQSARIDFVVAWHVPGLDRSALGFITGIDGLGREYARRFKDAAAVAWHVAQEFDRLSGETRRWCKCWYGSTLPQWALERTFANVSTLATATCLRFHTGRFYGWEGTHCCPGTCQHVWQYAQGVARIFPALERSLREDVDFGLAWREQDGAIDYRAEADRRVAHDGLAGTIIRAWREHSTSPDDAFLRRRWPRIKASIEHLLREDRDQDGLLEGAQYNTLDTVWHGPMGWISSLYVAALRAGAAMAHAAGDGEFTTLCTRRATLGEQALVRQLFNGDWFIHRPDPGHPEANSTGIGCHIDQVLGQSFMWQVGLTVAGEDGPRFRAVPREECLRALRSLYRWNLAPDIGPYRARFDGVLKGGRWYAMPGEGGLLMCTWPHGGSESATGKGRDAWAAGYFNECMSGFEHQVAAHMIYEGMVEEGLAVERLIHDRYHASRRNPFNEVECSNHYARAMASYGVFLGLCSFAYDGPKGRMTYSPKLAPELFRAAFTAADGWGVISQWRDAHTQVNSVEVAWGSLGLRTLRVELPDERRREVMAVVGGALVNATGDRAGRWMTVEFDPPLALAAGDRLEVALS